MALPPVFFWTILLIRSPDALGVTVTGGGSVAVGVVNLNLIAVGIVNQSQETVDKVHLVVLVVANHIAAGAVLVDFQPHAVFIIIVVGVFAGIFGEIMDRTVAIGIFHIGGFVVGIAIVLQLYLFHSLHDTEVDSGAYMHAQAKPAAGVIVLLAVSHGIAAVVGQIQETGFTVEA